jgi:hypothetical protein
LDAYASASYQYGETMSELHALLRRAKKHIEDWWHVPAGGLPPARSPELVEDIEKALEIASQYPQCTSQKPPCKFDCPCYFEALKASALPANKTILQATATLAYLVGDIEDDKLNEEMLVQIRKIADAIPSNPTPRTGDCTLCGYCAATGEPIVRATPPAAQKDAMQDAGSKMANAMFNLAQNAGCTLDSDDCALFDKLRKEWDAALRGEGERE